MRADERLLQAAEVIEKAAAYLEALESEKVQEERNAKLAEANKLAESITHVVGEELDPQTLEKLSQASPEVTDLIQRLSGGGSVDSLGGPPETVKSASVNGHDRVAQNVAAADARFLSFLTT